MYFAVRNVSVYYDKVRAVSDISLVMDAGEVAAHRPRGDGRPQALAEGRAVPWARAAPGARDCPCDPRRQPRGEGGRRPRRAELADGAQGLDPRIRPRDGAGRARGALRRSPEQRAGPETLSGRIAPIPPPEVQGSSRRRLTCAPKPARAS